MRLVFLLCIATLCSAGGRLPVSVYRTAEGLPRNSVGCMVAGQNGVMWFCTTEGLVRFDGQEFRVFGPEQGLPSRTVYAFFAARTGGYWIITDRGLCRLPPTGKIGDSCRVFTPTPAEGWIFGFLAESPAGDVWAASESRVFRIRLENATIEDIHFPLEPYVHVQGIAAGDAGTVLVGTERGVFEWSPGGKLRNLTAGMQDMGTSTIFRVASGDYWLATASGLFRMRLRGADRTPEFRGGWTADPHTYALTPTRDGGFWATMGVAAVQIGLDAAGDAHVLRRIEHENGFPEFSRLVAEDGGGRVWITTGNGEGLLRMADTGFTTYGQTEGLVSARIASIFTDSSGRLSVTTGLADSIQLLQNGRFLNFRVRFPAQIKYFGQGWNQFRLQAHDGEWWIPTGEGLLRYAASSVENLPRAPLKNWYRRGAGISGQEIFRVFEDSHGDIWISCDGPDGLLRWNRRTEKFQSFGQDVGWPPNQYALAFRESPPGTIWMTNNEGLVRFRNGRFQVVPFGGPQMATWSRDLFIDSAHHLWAATPGKGLFRCDDPDAPQPRMVHYTVRDGLASDFLRAITEDRRGFLYVSSVRGVDRIDPRAPIDPRHIRHFTAADGLPDNEHNVAYADPNGHLWFGTLNGLAEYDPQRAPVPSPPEAFFTRLLVRGEEIPMPWDGARQVQLPLASDRNQIQIEFSAASTSSPALRFQYRLTGGRGIVGEDTPWSEPAAERRVNYPALPRGRLHFEVRAINADGQISTTNATLELDVAAPFWQRAWFLLLVALCGAVLVTIAYRYRVAQLLAMERLRIRIATDLHDDIGASLSQIAILSEVARRDAGSAALGVISQIARETVEQMSDIVWAVNPRHDRFDSLLHRMRRFAGDTLGGAGIELQFESEKLPTDLTTPIEARRPLYLVFKEAINNAARHSGASRVTVGIEVARGVLRITIADNGRGFDPSAVHEGEGVANIARRMRDLGGTLEWDSPGEAGARLVIALPLKRNRPT
jgi:signal transduction histidine kinase/ligand-binding sensor domain-containing protein